MWFEWKEGWKGWKELVFDTNSGILKFHVTGEDSRVCVCVCVCVFTCMYMWARVCMLSHVQLFGTP